MYFDTLTCVDDGIIDSLFVAAKQRDERVKYILESDVIAEVKVVLTSVPQSRLPSVQLIAELVKSGITRRLRCCPRLICIASTRLFGSRHTLVHCAAFC